MNTLRATLLLASALLIPACGSSGGGWWPAPGTGTGAGSGSGSGIPTSGGNPAACVTPGTPAIIAISAGDNLSVVTWEGCTSGTSYNVYRSTTPGGPYSLLVSGAPGPFVTDAGADNGTTYYYVVAGVNGGVEGPMSNEMFATPASGTPEEVLIGPAGAGGQLAVFTLNEHFGVNHPDQIVEWGINGAFNAANAYMMGPGGVEVPYQVLAGGTRIAVRTDLPAGSTKTFTLFTGRAPAFPGTGLSMTNTGTYYEVVNGLTGVRVLSNGALPADLGSLLTPIQGILYRSGQWSGGPVTFHRLEATAVTGVQITVREQGALKIVVEVVYAFDRKEFNAGGVLIPASPGSYRCTVEVQAGQPSFLIEDDSDTELVCRIPIYQGLSPNTLRYRNRGGYGDVALRFNAEVPSGHIMQPNGGNPMYRRLVLWDPWAPDGGWTWQLYGGTNNLLGMFGAGLSRALGVGNAGPGLWTGPGPAAAISVDCLRTGSVPAVTAPPPPRMRFRWGILTAATSDQAGGSEPGLVGLQWNLHGGISLNDFHQHAPVYAEPPQGYGALFMPKVKIDAMIERVRTDVVYRDYLKLAEGPFQLVINMWADTSGASVEPVVVAIENVAKAFLRSLVEEDGVQDDFYQYWQGGNVIQRQMIWADQVMAMSYATQDQKDRVQRALVMLAEVVISNDYAPMFDGHGMTYGTANMPMNMLAYRYQMVVCLASHPMMSAQIVAAPAHSLGMLYIQVNEFGAPSASTHYIEAGPNGLMALFQMYQTRGIADYFATDPRVKKYAEFTLQLNTPVEPRFGTIRKTVCMGDASTESTDRQGVLGTGFANSDPTLSKRLMWGWRAQGSAHYSAFGHTIVQIDETLPDQDAALVSATIPGYLTALRSGWGTANESATYVQDGDFVFDHMTQERGEVILYAMGAPLAIDWGSLYNPHTGGALMHSTIAPDDFVGAGSWQGGGHNNVGWFFWEGSTLNGYQSATGSGGYTRSTHSLAGLEWTRAVSMGVTGGSLPVIVIQDSFAGTGAANGKAFTLNQMAMGSVSSPWGGLSPGSGFSGGAGVHRLGFTGQTWARHATGGIDWDLFVVAAGSFDGVLQEWSHNWHPSREMGQYQAANGSNFQERQFILRLHGNGTFRVVIVPHHKGTAPAVSVTDNGVSITVTAAGQAFTFNPDGTF